MIINNGERPNSILKPPFFIMKYLFGAQNSKLLKEILNDTDTGFIRWAMNKILAWEVDEEVKDLYHIHGSKDRLIPLKHPSAKVVNEGGHFMVVDKANEVSELVNEILRSFNLLGFNSPMLA